MATVAASNEQSRPSQNWVVSPLTDMLFIIATPILAFVWAGAVFRTGGGHEAVWTIFMVFNVAHHLPTFIRIYGDKDCVRRFRWSLMLGPLIPFTVAILVAGFFITNGLPINRLIFLWMVLTLWDPWHFLMQHYGFMRIYDRHNQAPRKLASWMDYLVSATWFVFIMMAAVQWFCGELLYSLYNDHGVPLLKWISPDVYHLMLRTAFIAAGSMSVVYAGYLLWCRWRGYFVSYAKLLLLAITFGVMYFTYIPNPLIQRFFPGWTYATGFATLGMVHVTQYLAIVWTYNRGLASKGKKRARPGIFTNSFARGGLIVVAVYVGLCLAYGTLLSEDVAPAFHLARWAGVQGTALQWVFGILWAVMFTSTFTHYYYDGFIWKVRHKENRENLAMQPGTPAANRTTNPATAADNNDGSASWWSRGGRNTLGATFFRQLIYFGVPIGLLIVTYAMVSDKPRKLPLTYVRSAEALKREGRQRDSIQVAQAALEAIESQLKVERTVAALDDRSRVSHQIYIADLTYWSAYATMNLVILPQREPTAQERSTHREQIRQAIGIMKGVLDLPEPQQYAHREFSSTREDLQRRVARWQDELRRLDQETSAATQVTAARPQSGGVTPMVK